MMNDIVEQFLRTGALAAGDLNEIAEQARHAVHREVQRSTASGLQMARRFVRRARGHGGVLLQAALRSLGWALHVSNKYPQARDAYIEARKLARRDPLTRGLIDRILIDVYMYLGDENAARRHARLAMATFRRIRNRAELEATRVNLANLLHRQDRHREAREHYRQARLFFEQTGDRLKLALCAYNEANTLVQLIKFPEAMERYEQAKSIFRDLGYDLYAVEADYGVAWLQMLQGDYHHALALLVRCKEAYSRHGHPRGVVLCLLDMTEIYLNLNLWTEALQCARRVEAQARRLGTGYEIAKGAFFRAQAAYAIGRSAECRQALERARRGFESVNNQGFLAAVSFFEKMSQANHGPDGKALEAIRAQFSRAQLPVWEAMCDLWLLRMRSADAEVITRLKSNPAVNTIPYLLAEWQIALGDRDASRARYKQARKRWVRAADILDDLRVKLPPFELRSAFMKGRSSPHERLIRMQAPVDPTEASAWAERMRSGGPWPPLPGGGKAPDARERARDSLSQLSRAVAAYAVRLDKVSERRNTARPRHDTALRKLQENVRHELSAFDSGRPGREYRLSRLKEDFDAVSANVTVVQFKELDDDLYAFVHSRRGTRSHRFIGGRRQLREFIGWWQILLSRSMLAGGRSGYYDTREEEQLFREFGDWLWTRLDIPAEPRRVLLLPEGRIANLPWTALAPGGERVADRYDLAAAPSLRHYLRARNVRTRSRRGMVFVGQAEGLAAVRRETRALATGDGDGAVLCEECRRADWPDSGSARFWHYAGHARLRSDNPLYSSLSLADGPLFAVDFQLKSARVRLVTLAACRTGEQIYMPGEESYGLVRSLLEMGAHTVIASNWAVDDASTALWMRAFYSKYLKGATIHDAARDAATVVRAAYPSAYHWAAFSIFGAF